MSVPAIRRVLAVGLTLLVCAQLVGGVHGLPAATGSADAPAAVAADGLLQAETPTPDPANDSVQHEDPDDVSEPGDTDRLLSWLNGRLAGQLSGSVIQLEQGEYEAAKQFVGDDYRDFLGKYVDVAGSTDGGDDDETANSYERVQRGLDNLASNASAYEETYERFQAAQQAGNEAEARRLARELQALAGQANRSASVVQQEFATIGNYTGRSFGDEIAQVETVQQRILDQQANVTEQVFVETQLAVAVETEQLSFTDPGTVSGQIVTAEGEPLNVSQVRIRMGTQTHLVSVNDSGAFAFDYRPTLVSAGATTVPVRYVPDPSSPYLGANTSVALSIDQVRPTVTVQTEPETLRFGDPVTVSGRVVANETGVGNVPVVVRLGDVRLGIARTTTRGAFSLRTTVPAGVDAGEQTVRSAVALEDRAIGTANRSTTVTVAETATSLSAEGERQNGTVVLTGALTTADGTAVPGQQLAITRDGRTLKTVQTTADGTFRAQLRSPTDDALNLSVAYTGEGTNLAGSTTEVQLSAVIDSGAGSDSGSEPDPGSESGDLGSGTIGFLTLGGLLVLLGVLAAFVLWRRQRRRAAGSDDGPTPAIVRTEDGPPSGSIEAALESAETSLAAGSTDAAVQALYPRLRQVIADRDGVQNAGTHWEFYRAVSEHGMADEAVLRPLQTVTEAYEHATFAPDSLDEQAARAAIEAGRELTAH